MTVKTPVHTSELLVQFFIPQAKRMKVGAAKNGEESWQGMTEEELAKLILRDAVNLYNGAAGCERCAPSSERMKELCLDIANRAAMIWGQLNDLHRPGDPQPTQEPVKEAT